MRFTAFITSFLAAIMLASCGGDTLPKPKGQLSLSYPRPSYSFTTSDCDYNFDLNSLGKVRYKDNCSAVIDYPSLNGSVFLTYRAVNNNINALLNDAQKLTYEHVRKADDIIEEKYVNQEQGAYGMFYDIKGDAASQSQFYITDSTTHFLTGSIYFNTKPNYDSIYPAAMYLKNDIRHLMESIKWREQQ
ncbi:MULTISPECIES: gliding motility lipoprotein GldD [unclassified Dokdonia]|uniref:gliding motility lipoprotein GldD n=2 Tax=Dokdonia TaxID=326319 RepID=UPI00020A7C3C|nr:gliding motility lipoprotein GldD [Dokdonia sp. 4H-3-7-5]AEE19362.1 gliding motility-associated lipoprotein GldD [Dokdonia sp. 4H-3-7-5]